MPKLIKTGKDVPPCIRRPDAIPPDAWSCNDPLDSFRWAPHGLKSVYMRKLVSEQMLCRAFTGEAFTLSSSFSGIGCFDFAAHMACSVVNDFLKQFTELEFTPCSTQTLYCVEKHGPCQSELLASPNLKADDCCVFGNILQLLPDALADELASSNDLTADQISAMIKAGMANFKSELKCKRHNKMCYVKRARVHSAGSPCTDHSAYGERAGDNGFNHRLYTTWAVHRLIQLEDIIAHENVPGFTAKKLTEDLGHVYIDLHIVLKGSLLGLPAKRDRTWSLMVKKDCIIMRCGRSIFTATFVHDFIQAGFHKHTKFDVFEFLFDTAGVNDEVAWSITRPSVRARRAAMEASV